MIGRFTRSMRIFLGNWRKPGFGIAQKRVGPIKKGFAPLAKKARVQDVSPHVLRLTAAAHRTKAGHSMVEIAPMPGHSDSRTTGQICARFLCPSYLSARA